MCERDSTYLDLVFILDMSCSSHPNNNNISFNNHHTILCPDSVICQKQVELCYRAVQK